MKIRFGLIVAFTLFIGASFAQVGDLSGNADWKERIFFGGNLGLQFGTITNIEVSPLAGYRINEGLSAGIGVTYIYYRIKFDNGQEFETDIYGGRLFARQAITDQFFAHAEYESLNLEFYNQVDNRAVREWVPGLFIGGGYFMPIGRNSGFSAMALYNAIYDELRSPYNSPWVFRLGFTVGF